jgi:hypothetical protein
MKYGDEDLVGTTTIRCYEGGIPYEVRIPEHYLRMPIPEFPTAPEPTLPCESCGGTEFSLCDEANEWYCDDCDEVVER